MSRPTISDKPLTPAEKQRRYRERLKQRQISPTGQERYVIRQWAIAKQETGDWTDEDQAVLDYLEFGQRGPYEQI